VPHLQSRKERLAGVQAVRWDVEEIAPKDWNSVPMFFPRPRPVPRSTCSALRRSAW
jgi:hypothetical protein